MQITLKLRSIQYADVALRLLALAKEKNIASGKALGRLLEALAELPEPLITGLLDGIPTEEKNAIVAALVSENREKLLALGNDLLAQNGITAHLRDLSLAEDLTLRVTAGDIDYTGLMVKYLPLFSPGSADTAMGKLISSLCRLPGFLLKGAVDALSQEKKDDLVAYLINANQARILQKLTALALEQRIRLDPEALTAES